MFAARKRQATWLALGLAGLFLLAACSSATPGPEAVLPSPTGEEDVAETTASPSALPPPTLTEEKMPAVTGSTEGADGAAEATPVETDGPTPAATSAAQDRDYEIVTLLPPDAIPAIDDPQFYDVLGADQEYDPEELVLGVEFDGDARAYPIAHLSAHEIVNDTVGGHPLAVTW